MPMNVQVEIPQIQMMKVLIPFTLTLDPSSSDGGNNSKIAFAVC